MKKVKIKKKNDKAKFKMNLGLYICALKVSQHFTF